MQIAQCASAYSQRLLGKMGTGGRLEIDDSNGERPVTPTLQTSIGGRNGQIDGALEPGTMHRREGSGATEVGEASPKFGGYGEIANLATGPALRDGKLQMNNIGGNRESTSPQNLQGQPISGKYQTITPLTGPPRRRRPPVNIEWGTPKWSSLGTAASKSRSNVHSKSEEKRLSEDLPPLSPQVSPRTIPSSPTEALNPSSTLWRHTIQIDINMPMGAATYESPRPPPISPPPRRSSLEQSRNPKLTKTKRDTTTPRGTFNPKPRSRQTPRRTSSLDFACRGDIARASVFSENIDPGFKKTQLGTATTWSPGNTIRKTRKAVGRALASTGLIGWWERERDDKEEWRAWKEGSIRHKLGTTRKLKPPEDSYPTPPPSPHPGDRVYLPGSSSTEASVTINVHGMREVQAAEAADDGAGVKPKLRRERITGFLRLMGK